MVRVNTANHEILDGNARRPQLTAELHVHLQRDLGDHAATFALVVDDLRRDYLRWYGQFEAAYAFDCVVAVFALRRHDAYYHLCAWLDVRL